MINIKLDGTMPLDRVFAALEVSNHEAVLEEPANAPVVEQVAKDYTLRPVGTLAIPDSLIGSATLKAKENNTYQSQSDQKVLELTVVDPLQRVQANVAYELILPEEARHGQTDGEGKLSESIPEAVQRVVLVIKPGDTEEYTRVIDVVEHLAPVDTLTGIRQRLEQRGHFIHPEVWRSENGYPAINEQALAHLQGGGSIDSFA